MTLPDLTKPLLQMRGIRWGVRLVVLTQWCHHAAGFDHRAVSPALAQIMWVRGQQYSASGAPRDVAERMRG